jgi:cell division protein FtsB
MTSPSASVETRKVGGGYKLLGGIALTIVGFMVLVILFSHRGFYNILRFRQEALQLERENVRLAAENDRLTRTIDRLHHDPEYIKDRIRQELNFIKKNEIIFQFPPEKPGTGANVSANGGTPTPARVQTVSERKADTSKWVSGPPAGSSQKKASRGRE